MILHSLYTVSWWSTRETHVNVNFLSRVQNNEETVDRERETHRGENVETLPTPASKASVVSGVHAQVPRLPTFPLIVSNLHFPLLSSRRPPRRPLSVPASAAAPATAAPVSARSASSSSSPFLAFRPTWKQALAGSVLFAGIGSFLYWRNRLVGNTAFVKAMERIGDSSLAEELGWPLKLGVSVSVWLSDALFVFFFFQDLTAFHACVCAGFFVDGVFSEDQGTADIHAIVKGTRKTERKRESAMLCATFLSFVLLFSLLLLLRRFLFTVGSLSSLHPFLPPLLFFNSCLFSSLFPRASCRFQEEGEADSECFPVDQGRGGQEVGAQPHRSRLPWGTQEVQREREKEKDIENERGRTNVYPRFVRSLSPFLSFCLSVRVCVCLSPLSLSLSHFIRVILVSRDSPFFELLSQVRVPYVPESAVPSGHGTCLR